MSSSNASTFGDLLKHLRKRAGMTQADLAAAVGYSVPFISNLELNQRLPDVQVVLQIFIPALGLQDERYLAAQLVELAALARGEHPPTIMTLKRETRLVYIEEREEYATTLPLPPTALLGRELAVKTLCDRLAGHRGRLLTLVGPPGIGKTRLAQEVASRMQALYQHGAIFVALSTISEPDLVASTLTTALGLTETSPKPPQTRLVEFLRHKELLLVLDNFEQITAAAPLVAELLTNCPRLHVLVTSRERLHLRAEQRFVVPPLELATAIELFVQRAQAVDAAFTLTPDNQPLLAETCQRLDCLPLAIELLAARIDLFSPQAMLARLQDHRLDLLTDGQQDLPVHQRTLRNAIHRSYTLLSEREQALFRTLGVFVGEFDLTAVTFLGFREELLQSLINKSLVQRSMHQGQGARYFLLEMLRAYATELLDSEQESQTAQGRHAQYFLELAEKAYQHLGHDVEFAYYDQLEREHDNLRAALRWGLTTDPASALQMAGALREFWCIRGHYSEGRQWLAQALAKSPAIHSFARSRALHAAGKIALRQTDFPQASPLFAEALQINTELGDQKGIAESLKFLAVVARDQNDPVTAKPLFEQSLALWRLTGDSHGVSGVLSNLGLIAMLQDDVSQAKTLLAEGLAIARGTHNENRTATILALLGYCDLYEGLPLTAMTYIRESMQLALRFDYRGVVAFCLEGMGEIMSLYGKSWEAQCCAAQLLGMADALRKAIHSPLAPVYHPLYHFTLSLIRSHLNEETLALAWAEGESMAGPRMTLDDTVGYALALTVD